MKLNKNYWYKYFVFYCPVCGHEDKYKERVYGKPRPEHRYDRYVWEIVCCCTFM